MKKLLMIFWHKNLNDIFCGHPAYIKNIFKNKAHITLPVILTCTLLKWFLRYTVQAFAQDLSCLSLWQVRLRNDRWDWGNFLQISYAFTKIGTFSSNQLYFNKIFTRNDRWEYKPVQRPDTVKILHYLYRQIWLYRP